MMPQAININIANNIVQSFLPHMIYHKVKAIRPVTKEYIVVSTCPCRAQLLMLLYCWFNGNKKNSPIVLLLLESYHQLISISLHVRKINFYYISMYSIHDKNAVKITSTMSIKMGSLL